MLMLLALLHLLVCRFWDVPPLLAVIATAPPAAPGRFSARAFPGRYVVWGARFLTDDGLTEVAYRLLPSPSSSGYGPLTGPNSSRPGGLRLAQPGGKPWRCQTVPAATLIGTGWVVRLPNVVPRSRTSLGRFGLVLGQMSCSGRCGLGVSALADRTSCRGSERVF